ncbi:MAG: hypothetical protein K2R98_06315 [Gemmataceae bacterium]|nr:hypothetical protein [Gemmataceae bacterium]
MAALASERPQTLSTLLATTRDRLRPLGLRDQALPEGLAEAVAGGGRTQLSATCWLLGTESNPLGECRIVRIVGSSSEIVNTMIFPRRPECLPTFVAELLVFGGCPRVAFVDVQVPGVGRERKREVAKRTMALAARHAHLHAEREAPGWSVEFSAGGHVFTRPGQRATTHDLQALYDDYLRCWCDLTAGRAPSPGPADPAAADELARFKQHHVEQSPVREFLAKVFGADWAYRFLHQFLYR